MSGTEIAVTGLGTVTPAGAGVNATWRTVREGSSTAANTHPRLAGCPVDFCASVENLDTSVVGRRALYRLDRSVQLLLVAAHEALTDAALLGADWDAERVGVVIGCGMGGVSSWEKQHSRFLGQGPDAVSPLMIPMTTPNMAAGEVALAYGARGPSFVVSTACASGATAISAARGLLASGECDIVIAGGTEAANTALTVAGFANLGALSRRREDPAAASRPFDIDRDGFVMAEAAAVLVLEHAAHAAARDRRPRALLAGCGSATDAHHPTAPHPEGRGASQAMRAALRAADLDPGDVDHVNAHGTSTVLNDSVEAHVITGVLPHGPYVTSTKGVLGHSLGATGAVEAVMTVLAIEQSCIPPTANCENPGPDLDLNLVTKIAARQRVRAAVSNSFGFGGHNVVLAFRTP
ncbi:beta-ketoacyl-[acyl-carrier-protein] synthase family protein [Streptomyces sp. NBC_00237]|uniref:beta-ketoacyl-[acyl-carrier-protein] synthase family protein n=1 Tax=Streptomyces sp. NBC_00237 TaxID=2975687 RepID=UPI002259E883|nr:beta-ketoacyl-[acyl-carrier-protein] synthase family protein [Streptomyces sp. NBC_00237]MCX5205724.1 beta-ketoacyl-[acyl-carrier-protein] synthase family protein [Streptomyces sp. NBC_00237]